MYSTSGGWIQLTDESGQFFPLAWLRKKETAVSRSTTEVEVAALLYVLFEEAIDLVELYSQVLGRRGHAQAQRRLRSLCQGGIYRVLKKAKASEAHAQSQHCCGEGAVGSR